MRLAESRAAAALFEERMASLIRRLLQDLTSRWDKLSLGLHSLSPLNILKKGYALCWKDDLRLIRRVEDVAAGQDVTVSFYKGAFTCRVKDVDPVTLLEDRLTKEKK
jgi:exodeoxyribonuclease VII large subunit